MGKEKLSCLILEILPNLVLLLTYSVCCSIIVFIMTTFFSIRFKVQYIKFMSRMMISIGSCSHILIIVVIRSTNLNGS